MCIPSGCLYISINLVRWGGKTDKGNVTILMFQCVKAYCAAFCASCALRWWKERQTASKLREDVAQLIQYLYLDKREFYIWRFNVKKTTLPLPAKILSCLYSVYMDAKFQGLKNRLYNRWCWPKGKRNMRTRMTWSLVRGPNLRMLNKFLRSKD